MLTNLLRLDENSKIHCLHLLSDEKESNTQTCSIEFRINLPPY